MKLENTALIMIDKKQYTRKQCGLGAADWWRSEHQRRRGLVGFVFMCR